MTVAWDPFQPGPIRITATRRLAHRLRADFDAGQAADGHAVWRTAEVLPWQAWLSQQFILARRLGRVGGRLLSPAAAGLLWRRIVEADPAAAQMVFPQGLAQAAHRAWRRMQAWQIPLSALAEDPTAESRAFARWAEQYAAWLAEHDAVDPDRLVELLDADSVARTVRLAGFDVLTPAQAALVGRLQSAGVEVVIEPPRARRGELSRVDCRDWRGELEAAAGWAAARLTADASARLAIVVPDLGTHRAGVRRTLERVLLPGAGYTGGPAPESRVFEIAEAPPLSSQAIVAAAFDLLAIFHGAADLAACGRLLRSGSVAGAADEAAPRAMLDAWLRRNAGVDLGPAALAPLAARNDCPVLAATIEVALSLTRLQAGRVRPSQWSGRFHDLLGALGWPGEGIASEGHQAALRLRELLAELASADDIAGSLDAREALRLLREYADGVSFEPQVIDAALTVIEPEASAGMSFDGLWITGMAASRWPAPASPDPFLPRNWQLRREMPGASAELAEREARRLFARLTRSADEVIVSVAQFEDDAPILPSALLAQVPRLVAGAGRPQPRLAAQIHAVRPTLEHATDARWPAPVPGRVARGGARLLELQSACPFRAGAELRLHARALEEPAPGLRATQRGQLVHGALARTWRVLRDQAGLQALDPAGVQGLLRSSIAAETARLRVAATPLLERLLDLESEWLALRLAELVECDRQRAPFVVESVETPTMATVGELRVEVQPDRVDRLADGSLAVIDYKTSADATPRAWYSDRPRLPQLPLYALALDATRGGGGRVRARARGRDRLRGALPATRGLRWDNKHSRARRTAAVCRAGKS